jgi:hypothetical protein
MCYYYISAPVKKQDDFPNLFPLCSAENLGVLLCIFEHKTQTQEQVAKYVFHGEMPPETEGVLPLFSAPTKSENKAASRLFSSPLPPPQQKTAAANFFAAAVLYRRKDYSSSSSSNSSIDITS